MATVALVTNSSTGFSIRETTVRDTLVAALVSCADRAFRSDALSFLLGLSSDELQFIAEFFGSCILEANQSGIRSGTQLAEKIAEFQLAKCRRRSEDQDHKMILLLEYLGRSGARSPVTAAGHA